MTPPGASVIVVAGEDTNDCKTVEILVRELRPALKSKLVRIGDPVRLKTATGDNLTKRIGTIVNKAKGRAARDRARLSGLIVHEDLDAPTGPQYAAVRRRLADALAKESPCGTALALAAEETEAWLLLFPDAFPHLHAGWSVPARLRGKNTGTLKNPKELLQNKIGSPAYRETEGPDIMSEARRAGLINNPVGINQSYTDFVADLENLGAN
ncbi:hypothetical protein ACIBLA_22460 [Streptomyces sp. NPDC050433]|uniref:hypothetical protein n=1 Tax=unclassified Streptomyces TaxID=2593676 RepID=UPI00341AAB9F